MTINGKLYSNILLVFALESEAGKEFESFNKLFVGLGKIKATYHLVKAIQKSKFIHLFCKKWNTLKTYSFF